MKMYILVEADEGNTARVLAVYGEKSDLIKLLDNLDDDERDELAAAIIATPDADGSFKIRRTKPFYLKTTLHIGNEIFYEE